MSKESESVKRWRKNTKDRMISSMGGKCYLCGYNKCTAALELHHLNPEEKSFGFGGMRANPISWNKIVEELRKCILLCSNCHKEVESLETLLPPDTQTTFNEEYSSYSIDFSAKKRNIDAMCVVCNTEFLALTKRNVYCSETCRKQSKKYKDIQRLASRRQRPNH